MKKSISLILCLVMAFTLCACGQESGPAVNVEKVSDILGMGALGINNRFSGLTVAQLEEKIYKDPNAEIAECKVTAGNEVQAGDLLFVYDMETMELNLEKAKLEVARIENTISGLNNQLENLKKEKEYASSSQQLSYTLEIQSTETSIREETYNLGVKQKALEQMEASMGDEEVYAPISGRIQSVNEEGGYDENGAVKPYITILDTTSFRIEGTINETNMSSIFEGMPILVKSRVDDRTWHGFISMIDYNNPVQSNNYYYVGDSSGQSSKYRFYVELDDSTGLMLGQHVYLEMDNGGEEITGLLLPEYYLNDLNMDTAWVWAASAQNTLEKRPVKLGAYVEDMGMVEILDGLTLNDYITFPDENWKVGMKVVVNAAADGN